MRLKANLGPLATDYFTVFKELFDLLTGQFRIVFVQIGVKSTMGADQTLASPGAVEEFKERPDWKNKKTAFDAGPGPKTCCKKEPEAC
ncbi:MAG: hypothetical protein AB1540_03475 [Bdellovibrionota bacterium]